jgi:hypothetical protein
MFYKFNLTDALLFISAFASLVYSEIYFFDGGQAKIALYHVT